MNILLMLKMQLVLFLIILYKHLSKQDRVMNFTIICRVCNKDVCWQNESLMYSNLSNVLYILNKNCSAQFNIKWTCSFLRKPHSSVQNSNPKPCVCKNETHKKVGILSLDPGQGRVTAGAVMLTEVVGSLRVGGNQQLLDVTLKTQETRWHR